jgi:hypothetical protein
VHLAPIGIKEKFKLCVYIYIYIAQGREPGRHECFIFCYLLAVNLGNEMILYNSGHAQACLTIRSSLYFP